MACLRPGGVAVHTTEFTLTSESVGPRFSRPELVLPGGHSRARAAADRSGAPDRAQLPARDDTARHARRRGALPLRQVCSRTNCLTWSLRSGSSYRRTALHRDRAGVSD